MARRSNLPAAMLAVWLAGSVPVVSRAASLAISNYSFEVPALANGVFNTTAPPPGWSVYGTGIDFGYRTIGVLNPNTTTLYADPVPDGQNVSVVFLLDDVGDQTNFAGLEAGIQQTLSNTLQTLTHYTLTVEVGSISNDATFPHNQFQFDGFPGYRIDLLAGGAVIASDNNSLAPADGRFVTSTVEVSIAATNILAGQLLGIRLVNLNSAPGIEVNFDAVRLDAEPEPALLAGVLAAGDDVHLVVSNLAVGGSHVLMRSEDLTADDWTNLAAFVGQSVATNLVDANPPEGRAFYRVESE